MKRFRYPSASVAAHCSSRLGIARVCGIVTPATAGQIISDSVHWTDADGQLANVVTYSGACMAIKLDQLLHAARRAGRLDNLEVTPTALVVSHDQLALFSGYAQASMAVGILKAAFLTEEEARRWAATQAAVRARRLELLARAQSYSRATGTSGT